jgi:hypothetical protein
MINIASAATTNSQIVVHSTKHASFSRNTLKEDCSHQKGQFSMDATGQCACISRRYLTKAKADNLQYLIEAAASLGKGEWVKQWEKARKKS